VLVKYLYAGLFLFSFSLFLFHFIVSGQAVYGDGIGYYAHLHSWVIDGDWDYTNEYRHLYDHDRNNLKEDSLAPNIQIVGTTSDGKAENFYGTGVAVLLLPFFLLAHFLSLLSNVFGANLPVLGYSDLYQILTGLGAVFYAICGVWILEKTIFIVIKDSKISLLSSFVLFLSSSLIYYGGYDVLNSHFASFFLSSLFFYLLFSRGQYYYFPVATGVVAGLLTINRLQDSAIIIVWGIDLLWSYFRSSSKNIKIMFAEIGKFTLGLLFALIPMVIHWSKVIGNPLAHPYLRSVTNNLQKPSIDVLGSLFDPVTGLFTRTPLILVLFVYFLLIRKKNTRYLVLPFLFFVIQFVIITIQGGWSAAAFGGRMYLSSLPFFGILLGKLLMDIRKRGGFLIYFFAVTFILINFISIAAFIFRDKGASSGGRGVEKYTIKRIENLFLSPFSQ